MGTFRRCAVIILAALAVVLAGCSKTVEIGAVISETGAASSYGAKVKKGIELAREQINAAGGFEGKTFDVLYRDDSTNPEVGRQVVRELIEEAGVKIIIGAVSSSVTVAIAPICQEKEVVLLSPTASAPELTDAGSYIFRNQPSDILEGTAMANFARDLGLERVAVFAADNEYGRGLEAVFVNEFQSRFRQIVSNVSFTEGTAAELAGEVAKLEELKPDGVYIAAYIADIAELVRQIRDAGLQSIILTSGAVTDRELADRAGPAAENLVFPQSSTFDPESEDPKVREFVDAYRERYDGEDPDSFAAQGYDALRLLLLGMEVRGSSHPQDVRFGIGAISDYQGPAGRVAFDENGDVIRYPRLYVIRQGRAIAYDRFTEEGGSLQPPGRS